MKTKAELLKEIEQIEEREQAEADEKRRQDNYKAFKNRVVDFIIGKAHCEFKFKDNGWHHPAGHHIPYSVTVNGNCGHTYFPTAQVTEATNIYFHNVWTDKQRHEFEVKLNALVQKEVERISKSLRSTLEILGLQSTSYMLHQSNYYPQDKIKEIEAEIWDETVKVLDQFKDKEFTDLMNIRHWFREDGTHGTTLSPELYHSKTILMRYLNEKRPHLLKDMEEVTHET